MSSARFAAVKSLAKITRLPRLFRDLGTPGALRYLARRLAGAPSASAATPKIDVLGDYDFIIRAGRPPADANTNADTGYPPRTLNWVIPGFEAGSGGHMTIFRMIGQLERLGFVSRIVIVGPTRFRNGREARLAIRSHFVRLAAVVTLGEDSLRPAEFSVATEWRTAYSVRRFAATRHKLYFIQDMEPHFFPHSSHYALAEATYRFGFTGITVGDWLAQTVQTRYGMPAFPFQMGAPSEYLRLPTADRKNARSLDPQVGPSADRRRVFFYARHVTPRRGFELGLLALALLHRTWPQGHPPLEFVFAGWDVSGYHIPFPHHNAGVVPHAELAQLYQRCDCALVLSLTNLSLLPIELMACGCPVVSNRGPNVEWQLRDGDNALLADATPEALAAALDRLLRDEPLRQRLTDNGLRFARGADWGREAEKVAGHLESISKSDHLQD